MNYNPIITNLERFDTDDVITNCAIITVKGQDGFIYVEPTGSIHIVGMDADVHVGDVQILTDLTTGRKSAGWTAY